MFLAASIVCDDYFLPSLEIITECKCVLPFPAALEGLIVGALRGRAVANPVLLTHSRAAANPLLLTHTHTLPAYDAVLESKVLTALLYETTGINFLAEVSLFLSK